ncbi:MAG: hypothetical protein Q8O30_04705, partial [Candidatus Omnitrophota bacterium]|nr:hypothetical protein [Candidatus Omnitrophota bacterium]
MKKILLAAIFIAVITPFAFCQKDELSVEVVPKKALLVINSDVFLPVLTRVINTTDKEQAIYMWSCCYEDSWNVDNPLIVVDRAVCVENHMYSKLLKPGEKFEKDIQLRMSDQAKPGDITFRLGFHSSKNETNHRKTEEKIYWSN